MLVEKGIKKHFDKLHLPKGKTIVITGGNSGIGFAVAELLSQTDWDIILAIRNLEKGEKAKQEILKRSPQAKIILMELDLSKRESILSFASKIQEEKIDIDVFYANAGIYRLPYARCYGGLESHMAVNAVGNYILYQELRPYFRDLPHSVKFILTSSVVARLAKITPESLFGENPYNKRRAYNNSKLAVNYLYSYLYEQEQNSNIIPLLVHPGIVFTPLIEKAYGKTIFTAGQHFMRLFSHKPRKAALSTCYLLQEEITSPCFCGPRGLFHISGYPKIYPLYQGNIKNIDEFMATIDACLKE